jgi:SLT domain-containing protein
LATITSLGFNVTSKWDGSGVDKARKDIEKLRAEVSALGKSKIRVSVAVDSKIDHAKLKAELDAIGNRHKLKIQVETDTKQIQTQLNGLARTHKVNLRAEFDARQIQAALNRIGRENRLTVRVHVDISEAENQIRALATKTATTRNIKVKVEGDGLGKLILMNITMRAAIVAALVLTGTFLGLGSAAALVGAAITLGIGGGMIAAAAVALKSNEQVVAGFERLKATAQTAFAGVADSMIGPLVDAMALLEAALVRIAPLIRRAFESTVPLVEPLTEGLIALVENTLPGFLTLLERMVPVAEGARRGFANFGTGLSEMFAGLSLGTEGFGEAIDITFTEVGRFLAILGVGFGRLADDGAIALDGLLGGINALVEGLLDGMKPAMDVMAVPLANFTRALGTELGDSLRTILPALGRVAAVIFDILTPAMERILPPLSTVVARMLDGLLPALESAKPWIDRFVDGIVAVLDWITPFADKLGIAATGIWLVNAALNANPFVLAASALLLLVGYLKDLEDRTKIFSETWAQIWPALEPFVTPVKNVLAELRDTLDDIFGQTPSAEPITGPIHSLGAAAWEEQPKVESFGTTLRNTFGPDLVMTIANFKVGWDDAVANIRDGMIKMVPSIAMFIAQHRDVFNVIGNVKMLFVEYGDIIWDTYNGTIRPALEGISQVVQGAMTIFGGMLRIASGETVGLKDAVLGMWTLITGAFTNSAQIIVNITNNAVRLILAPFQWLYDTLVGHSIVPDLMARIEELFMLLPNKVVGVVTGFCDTIKGAFEDLKNGVVGTIQALSDKIGEIWGGIREKFATPINFVIDIWNDNVSGKFGLPGMEKIAIPGKADGGSITGVGGPREDNIPIWASVGEHMWTAAEVKAAGGHRAVEALRSSVLGYSNGGGVFRVPKYPTPKYVPPGNFNPDAEYPGGSRVRIAPRPQRGGYDPRDFRYRGYAAGGGIEVTPHQQSMWMAVKSAFPDAMLTSGLRHQDVGSGFDYHMQGKAIDVDGPRAAVADWVNAHFMPSTLELILGDGYGRNIWNGQPHQYSASTLADHGGSNAHTHWANAVPIGSEFAGLSAQGLGSTVVSGSATATGQVRQFISGLFTRLTDPLVNAVDDPMAPMSKPLGSLPRASVSKVRDAIADKLRGAEAASGASFGDPGGTIPDGERLDIINKALILTNTPPPDSVEAWQRGLNTLITRESSWNPRAINDWDSNAAEGFPTKGLGQARDDTFAANAVPGHGDIYAPVDNVAAIINYIKGKYGSITAVQQANAGMPHKGYEDGTVSADPGWNLVGENGPEAVQFRGGEPVKSFDDIVTALRDPNSETSQKALGAMREFGKANAEQFLSDLTGGGMGDGFIPQLFKQGGEYGAKVVEEHIHYHVGDMDEAIRKENQRRKEQALGF